MVEPGNSMDSAAKSLPLQQVSASEVLIIARHIHLVSNHCAYDNDLEPENLSE